MKFTFFRLNTLNADFVTYSNFKYQTDTLAHKPVQLLDSTIHLRQLLLIDYF